MAIDPEMTLSGALARIRRLEDVIAVMQAQMAEMRALLGAKSHQLTNPWEREDIPNPAARKKSPHRCNGEGSN
ncbi:hypothetical protein DB346_05360 [Verrucomicrobia bacterium LW23]|nr:hypothetical protein DB346_05360 [Verrucomicrobia bacterium LW23]